MSKNNNADLGQLVQKLPSIIRPLLTGATSIYNGLPEDQQNAVNDYLFGLVGIKPSEVPEVVTVNNFFEQNASQVASMLCGGILTYEPRRGDPFVGLISKTAAYESPTDGRLRGAQLVPGSIFAYDETIRTPKGTRLSISAHEIGDGKAGMVDVLEVISLTAGAQGKLSSQEILDVLEIKVGSRPEEIGDRRCPIYLTTRPIGIESLGSYSFRESTRAKRGADAAFELY